MKIALDISPLATGHFLKHRVRGTGFYIENLKRSFLKYHSENEYIFFSRSQKLPGDVDIVHHPYFEPFFLTLPLIKPSRFVVTIHDLTPLVFPEHFPPGLQGRIKWQMQKILLSYANGIITDSFASKKDIVRFTAYPKDRVHVVYLAPGESFKQVKSTPLLDRIRAKYKLPKKFILYVGDATWNKNLPSLLRAVRKTNLTLVMVGQALVDESIDARNPWNKDAVEVHALAKDDKRIIRLGFVPMDDLVGLYSLATVFVMPSLYEGFGLPILEAMACGLPVVTTKAGSLAEVAGEAALFVDPYDETNIAEGVERVFSDKKLQKTLSRKGLVQAKKFSWKKTAAETIHVYAKI